MTTTAMDYKIISGIFSSPETNHLLDKLAEHSVSQEEISVLMSENTGHSMIKMVASNKASEGVTVGGITGGLLGAIVGGLTLVGTVLAPGVGLFAAGPIIGILTGTAAGASAGGILGGLVGLGLPEHEAKVYEGSLHEPGNMLVSVKTTKDNVKIIEELFKQSQGKNIHVSS